MSIDANLDSAWIDEQYRRWQRDPASLPPDWQAFFHGFDLAREKGAGLDPTHALKQSGVQSLLYRYRDIGHLLACTDPLSPCPTEHPFLDLAAFGLSDADLDTTFHTRRFHRRSITLRELLTTLRAAYCGSVGVEFMHIPNPDERQWLIDRLEPEGSRPPLSRNRQQAVLEQLLRAARFEAFLHRRYLGQKRFSLEGGEILLPLLQAGLEQAAALGVSDVVLGMAHRGRLNVLANLFGKPLEVIFAEFEDNLRYQYVGDGDVKYHKGYSTDLDLPGGQLHLTLAANPSHLELVDPVVLGKCRARQDEYGEDGPARVLPLLIHGDAAFAGQGLVAEVLNLSQLKGYGTGGTLHVVLNNQIGFTTVAEDARSTRYATDIAKMLAVPIFHIHGEDPEAAVRTVELALSYRQRFGRDVVVEVVCFRRHGHNEGDEPNFTQPLMYDRIKAHPSVAEVYGERLQKDGFTSEEIQTLTEQVDSWLEAASGQGARVDTDTGFSGKWQGLLRDWSPLEIASGVSRETLRDFSRRLSQLPADFTPHSKIAKLLERRRETVESGDGIDWGTAEILAYASLVATGRPVRLSGQDSQRGTFNHRHSVLVDVKTGTEHVPINNVAGEDGTFRVYNSPLSEASVLGFEYGYALENPRGLTLWEAQFGDFANGAQALIDQFVAGSSSKWDRSCGVVLLLPHGYEGQGAEHSSARIERFLQLCADYNLQVVNPSTPAQLFHLLRRQVLLPFRRPLVVFTPKSLLRHPACVSSLDELANGSFQEILPPDRPPEQTGTIMLCSGKLFYELDERRRKDNREDVALVRIEQLYPLRVDKLTAALAPYLGRAKVFWVQEEPLNAGPWSYLKPHLTAILGDEPRYVGRYPSAAPAVGSHRLHAEEQQNLIDYAFGSLSPRKDASH